jgi:hypothetical protein
MVEHLGEGGVALGSDFDGALVPEGIREAAEFDDAHERFHFAQTIHGSPVPVALHDRPQPRCFQIIGN